MILAEGQHPVSSSQTMLIGTNIGNVVCQNRVECTDKDLTNSQQCRVRQARYPQEGLRLISCPGLGSQYNFQVLPIILCKLYSSLIEGCNIMTTYIYIKLDFVWMAHFSFLVIHLGQFGNHKRGRKESRATTEKRGYWVEKKKDLKKFHLGLIGNLEQKWSNLYQEIPILVAK